MLHPLDLSFDGREPAAVMLQKAELAIEHGVGTIWLACHLFQRDPIAMAVTLLNRHSDVRVVLVAISPYVVHPVQIAMSAATISELFPGRIALCLGAGAPDDLADAGIERQRPLQTLEEALRLCRELFSGRKVAFEGERFRISNRAMGNGRQPVPIYLAASGPRMLELAGREADGVLLSAGASRAFTRQCIEKVHPGRPKPPDFLNCGLVYAAVDADKARAIDRVRPKLALTLRGAHHAPNLEAAGTEVDQSTLRAAISAGRASEAARLIADDVVLRHAAVGSPTEFREIFESYRAAGLDRIVLASLGEPRDIAAALQALKPQEGQYQ